MVKTSVYLPEALKARLGEASTATGDSEATIIRSALERWLARLVIEPRRRHAPDLGTMDFGDPHLAEKVDEALAALHYGETIAITRGEEIVAELRPARRRTGSDLRAALGSIRPPDDRFSTDIAGALALISAEGNDPWAGA
jgi:antitoxin (DNA-binding transcriptional repressor) of toxin-antitoxin stability system